MGLQEVLDKFINEDMDITPAGSPETGNPAVTSHLHGGLCRKYLVRSSTQCAAPNLVRAWGSSPKPERKESMA